MLDGDSGVVLLSSVSELMCLLCYSCVKMCLLFVWMVLVMVF